jgi:hypothetical protein
VKSGSDSNYHPKTTIKEAGSAYVYLISWFFISETFKNQAPPAPFLIEIASLADS